MILNKYKSISLPFLENFRTQEDYVGLSFETISASGLNGAVIHYRPQDESNRTITKEEMYLCDSGAQFLDGTTDVTRTVHFGTPSQYQKECFTRVVKGHIGLARMVFPNKLSGQMLDTMARKPLWEIGLDYMHGTGHGVGMYLNVHEGPIGISFRASPEDQGITEGMFLSNEPGYYEDGQFGIRIESIVLSKKVSTKVSIDRNIIPLFFAPPFVHIAVVIRQLMIRHRLMAMISLVHFLSITSRLLPSPACRL